MATKSVFLSRRVRAAGSRIGVLLGTTLLGVSVCAAAPITYTVDQAIGLGSVTGTIQTDGVLGVLSASDLTGWNLTLNGVGASYNLTGTSSVVNVVGNDLTATALDLRFNYSGDDGYLLFQQNLFSGMHYYCDATAADTCLQGASVVPQSISDPSAQTRPQSGNQVIATAMTATPEPGSIALLLSGIAGLVASRWPKRVGSPRRLPESRRLPA